MSVTRRHPTHPKRPLSPPEHGLHSPYAHPLSHTKRSSGAEKWTSVSPCFEVPFAHTLPFRLQIRRLPKRAPAFRELGDPALPHLPKFLPALPDEHTFMRTPGELSPLSSLPNGMVGTYVGHKQNEDALEGLKTASNEVHKRKRFGELVTNPPVDGVLSKQHDLWQASAGNQIGHYEQKQSRTAHRPTASSSALHDFKWDDFQGKDGSPATDVVSRETVEFSLDFRAKAKASSSRQGLILVHFSIQLERFVWNRGCA